jgi:membrane protein
VGTVAICPADLSSHLHGKGTGPHGTAGLMLRQIKTIAAAVHAVYADSGFAMAGAVAFSFVLSLFPFCIFLGAMAGLYGGEALAKQGIERLFEIVPGPVAKALAPQVMEVMGRTRLDLLTFGALISLFFATSAIENLRTALNVAYRQKEKRPYLLCLLQSSLIVIVSAVGMLVLTWGVVVGPELAGRIKPARLQWLADTGWIPLLVRYSVVVLAIGLQLLAYHLWLAAGRRRLADVWPGVLLSIVLWLLAARLFGTWLNFTDYSRFYAGLTSIMSALVFFQLSAIIIILGAELNRGLSEIKETVRRQNGTAPLQAALSPPEEATEPDRNCGEIRTR